MRKSGDVNFFVGSREYGFVEVAHLALCHAVIDIDMGWGQTKQADAVKKDWQAGRAKRVLVTGGAGYVGSNLGPETAARRLRGFGS